MRKHILLFIQIQAKSGDKISKSLTDRLKLKTFVALTMDIASASPRRYFFEARSQYFECFFFS
jgi:hypothetical protein